MLMAKIEKIKKLMETRKEAGQAEKKQAALEGGKEEIDRVALDQIVDRLRGKYIQEGVLREGAESQGKLKGMIAGTGEMKLLKGGTSRELTLVDSPIVRFLGQFYLKLQSPFSAVSKAVSNILGPRLEEDLLASYSKYSLEQYLTLSIAATSIIWLITLALLFILMAAGKLGILPAVVVLLIVPFICMAFAVIIPRSNATKLGAEIDKELPFALRHMSIEIRAGVGIYKTMESVARVGYGPLSQGFLDVLANIEKGMPTEEALEAWAERSRSEGLRRMISHLVRALRTGGNLSEIMVTIAEDISFEQKTRIADFAEKLNLMALFLMVVAIVLPVMITILTSIGASPAIKQYMAMFSFFSPAMLMIMYFIVCPALLFVFMFFIKSADPGA
jgi:flagellar protein FlaJ